MSNIEVLEHIDRCLHKWHVQVNLLRALRILLGVIGLASSIAIAWAAGNLSVGVVRGLALVAAASAALAGFSDLGSKANNMRDAWRLLTAECLRYKSGGGTIEKLIDTYEEAERLVGDVNFRSKETLGEVSIP